MHLTAFRNTSQPMNAILRKNLAGFRSPQGAVCLPPGIGGRALARQDLLVEGADKACRMPHASGWIRQMAKWKQCLQRYIDFKAKNGREPGRYDRPLYGWSYYQRQNKERLTLEKSLLLREAGFPFTVEKPDKPEKIPETRARRDRPAFEPMRQKYILFRASHPDGVEPSQHSRDKDEVHLARWRLGELVRFRHGKLCGDEITLLDQAGMKLWLSNKSKSGQPGSPEWASSMRLLCADGRIKPEFAARLEKQGLQLGNGVRQVRIFGHPPKAI